MMKPGGAVACSAHWRFSLTTGTAPFYSTAARIAGDPAIAQVLQGHLLLMDVLTRLGRYLLDDVLPANTGQS